MDPLSISAGVVGLLATATQVIKFLDTLHSNIQNAPRTITWAVAEVTDVRSIIARLNDLLHSMDSIPRSSRALVGVQEAVVAISEMVVSFDCLAAVLKPFVSESGIALTGWNQIRWLRKQDDVARFILQLQSHKSSITLIMNILQCDSDLIARESLAALEIKMNTLLEESSETRRRLENVEKHLTDVLACGKSVFFSDHTSIKPRPSSVIEDSNRTVRSPAEPNRLQPLLVPHQLPEDLPEPACRAPLPHIEVRGPASDDTSIVPDTADENVPADPGLRESSDADKLLASRLEFEVILETSNVYRRVNRAFDSFSILSTNDRSVTGTVLTSYSLADDASILSAVPLLDRAELRCPEFYPAKGDDRKLSSRLLEALSLRSVDKSKSGDLPSKVTLQTLRNQPNCGQDVMGLWHISVIRIWRPLEFRFEVQYKAPVIFVCPPTNNKGPIFGAIYIIDGSPASRDETWSRHPSDSMEHRLMSARQAGRQTRRTPSERATWDVLISTLQRMEADSRSWQESVHRQASFTSRKRSEADLVADLRAVESAYTLSVAIQRKRFSWDAMPHGLNRPYAVTAMCHLIEMLAILGIHWIEFDRLHNYYFAEGNGFMVRGNMLHDFGIVFTFQVSGQSRFADNRIVHVDEVKELCFGFVPTIFQQINRRPPFLYNEPHDLGILTMGSRGEIARTLTLIGCNRNTVNCFQSENQRDSHLFPVAFEILGMLGRTLHIRNSCFRVLPNPTPYSWNKENFSLPGLLAAYNNLVREEGIIRRPNSFVVSSIEQHGARLEAALAADISARTSPGLQLLNALHDALDDMDEVLTARQKITLTSSIPITGRDHNETSRESDESLSLLEQTRRRQLVQDVLRCHLQQVLQMMNQKAEDSQSATVTQSIPPVIPTPSSNVTLRFEDVDAAAPEEREVVFLSLYFKVVLREVESRLRTATARSQHPAPSLHHAPPLDPSIRRSGPDSSPEHDHADIHDDRCLSPVQEKAESDGNGIVSNEEDKNGENTSESKPSLRDLPTWKISYYDIWCTLVFRMICWLMLHDFHERDVQVAKSELLGSRMPVYIS